MKFILPYFALCWISVNADTIADFPIYRKYKIKQVLEEISEISNKTAVALDHEIKQIFVDYEQKVDYELTSFNLIREENGSCVAAEITNMNVRVSSFRKTLQVCNAAAANSLAADMKVLNQQFAIEGSDLFHIYQNCIQFKISVRRSCFAYWNFKADLYMNNIPESINTIKKSTDELNPPAVVKADACASRAAAVANTKSVEIHLTILDCMNKL